MAKNIKNIKKGNLVIFEGEKYRVKSITSGSSSKYLIGGSSKTQSNLLWLEPIDQDTEEIDGWVNERRVKLLKMNKKRK